jgi:hypothetical protein
MAFIACLWVSDVWNANAATLVDTKKKENFKQIVEEIRAVDNCWREEALEFC